MTTVGMLEVDCFYPVDAEGNKLKLSDVDIDEHSTWAATVFGERLPQVFGSWREAHAATLAAIRDKANMPDAETLLRRTVPRHTDRTALRLDQVRGMSDGALIDCLMATYADANNIRIATGERSDLLHNRWHELRAEILRRLALTHSEADDRVF